MRPLSANLQLSNTFEGRCSAVAIGQSAFSTAEQSQFLSFSSYNVSFMVVTYFLPMLSMSVTYAKIGAELWGARAIGEATAVQRESINSKRRVRRTKSETLRL